MWSLLLLWQAARLARRIFEDSTQIIDHMSNSSHHHHCLERCKLTWRGSPDKYSGIWILLCISDVAILCHLLESFLISLHWAKAGGAPLPSVPLFNFSRVLIEICNTLSSHTSVLIPSQSPYICILSMVLDSLPTNSSYLLQQEYSKRTFSSVVDASCLYIGAVT